MLILASESPRRRELLQRIVSEFTAVSPHVEELEDGEDLKSLPEKNALLKARAVAERFPDAVVIGADTAVFADGKMLGKPTNAPQAEEMLAMLSGRSHQVISGVAVVCQKLSFLRTWSECSEVAFKELSQGEISEYMALVNVFDKAGAYAVQEHPELLGAQWDGELENIIGLPLVKLEKVLRELM